MQKLRHLDLLLAAPWSVQIGPQREIAFDEPIDIQVSNPVSFIIQKLLIHEKRKAGKKAQGVLYIHDTLSCSAARWTNSARFGSIKFVRAWRPTPPGRWRRALDRYSSR